MAYIGHRCSCGHTDLSHTGEGDKAQCTAVSGGSCGRGCTPAAAPELVPTFDINGRSVERVITPGDGLPNEAGGFTVRTCACDACTDLHQQLTAA